MSAQRHYYGLLRQTVCCNSVNYQESRVNMGLVVSTILHLAELHNAERFVVVTSHSALLELTFSSVLKICSSNLP